MRHSGGANFAFYILLSEVSKRDVRPHIPAEVYQDRAQKTQIQTEFCNCVVRFDLCRVGIPFQTHLLYKVL